MIKENELVELLGDHTKLHGQAAIMAEIFLNAIEKIDRRLSRLETALDMHLEGH